MMVAEAGPAHRSVEERHHLQTGRECFSAEVLFDELEQGLVEGVMDFLLPLVLVDCVRLAVGS